MAIVRVPARLDYPFNGGPGVNVWHVSTASLQDTQANLEEAVDALAAFYTAIRPWYPTGMTVTLGEGMIIDPLGSPEYATDYSTKITSSGGSATVTSNLLAIVCGWRTSSATRSGRGRTFIGPLVTQAGEGDGTPAPDTLADIRGAAATLVADSLSANGWAIGVLSTKQGTFRDITGVTVKDRFAFLSSRRD